MINITKYKNKEKSTVEYKLEITKENKLIFSTKFEIENDKNTDDKICDRIAKLKLLNILMEDGSINIYEELSNIIPVFEPKVNFSEEAKEEYLLTQKENILY